MELGRGSHENAAPRCPDGTGQGATTAITPVPTADHELNDLIQHVKEQVEEKEGIPPEQQRLIFSGKQMSSDSPLSEYGLEAGSVIHLVLALRGGQ